MVRNYCIRGIWVLVAISSAPAMAWVEVCNGRGDKSTAAVALGAKDPPGVSTGGHTGVAVEGWWQLSPGECATVSEANASHNWLYFHAHGKGGTLQGDARLCVRNKAFKSRQQFLRRDETCKDDWKEAGFVRHQSSAKNYKFTIK